MRFASSSAVCALLFTLHVVGAGAQQTTTGRPDAAKLKNPVAANAASVAAGKKLYDAQCASCHGTTGRGDGKGGELLKPKPSDLTDSEWKHGSSEAEIFTVIRDGSKQTGMRAYGSRLPANDIWNLVNYVRSLGPKTAKSH